MKSYRILIINAQKEIVDYLINELSTCDIKIQIRIVNDLKDESIEIVEEHAPDLIFIDINMINQKKMNLMQLQKRCNCKIVISDGYDLLMLNSDSCYECGYILKQIDLSDINNLFNH